ncbi:MAG: hypothetical protein KDA42_02745 [Planctomycetales bacterium]|nr:hypothetical protein [Planctomycetales bacterium]
MAVQTESQMRQVFDQLTPGEQVEVEHEVKVGLKIWTTTTRGTVVRKDRRRHGLHNRRNFDDRVWSDILVLCREDGELTTLTIDEFTHLTRIGATS